jgi:hypothetical protein
MKSFRLIMQAFSVTGILALACGCTHLRTPPVQMTTLPAGQPLPHHVALVLDQEMADYKHEYHEGGDTFIYAFGPALQDYARAVATKSFAQVEVVSSLDKAAALTAADLILIPRPLKSAVSIPVNGLKQENLTFAVSWTAKDRATQNTVWLTTVTAEAAESKWNVNIHHGGKLYQRLFDDLSLKTYNAFQEAAEFRNRSH